MLLLPGEELKDNSASWGDLNELYDRTQHAKPIYITYEWGDL